MESTHQALNTIEDADVRSAIMQNLRYHLESHMVKMFLWTLMLFVASYVLLLNISTSEALGTTKVLVELLALATLNSVVFIVSVQSKQFFRSCIVNMFPMSVVAATNGNGETVYQINVNGDTFIYILVFGVFMILWAAIKCKIKNI